MSAVIRLSQKLTPMGVEYKGMVPFPSNWRAKLMWWCYTNAINSSFFPRMRGIQMLQRNQNFSDAVVWWFVGISPSISRYSHLSAVVTGDFFMLAVWNGNSMFPYWGHPWLRELALNWKCPQCSGLSAWPALHSGILGRTAFKQHILNQILPNKQGSITGCTLFGEIISFHFKRPERPLPA